MVFYFLVYQDSVRYALREVEVLRVGTGDNERSVAHIKDVSTLLRSKAMPVTKISFRGKASSLEQKPGAVPMQAQEIPRGSQHKRQHKRKNSMNESRSSSALTFPSEASVESFEEGGQKSTALGVTESKRGCMRVRTLEESLNGCREDMELDTYHDVTVDNDIDTLEGSGESKVSIQFDRIEIREYMRGLGDNPACSSGPPISLGWSYRPNSKVFSIDEYEKNRPAKCKDLAHLVLSPLKRERILLQMGYTSKELMVADLQIRKHQLMREKTIEGLKYANMEEAVETIKRAMKKVKRNKKVAKVAKAN